MEISESTPEVNEALAAIGHRIYLTFGSFAVGSSTLGEEDGLHAALVNESQRFGLWAKNLGLYHSGHSSLDYRFRDAPLVYEYARQLLVDLEKSLLLIKDDMSRPQPQPSAFATFSWDSGDIYEQDENSNRTTDTIEEDYDDSESDESSNEDESYPSYQQDSLSTIVTENAKLIIDRLYKLSFKIRNPATRLGFSKARSYREIDEETGVDLMDGYASFDLRHMAEIFARDGWRSQEECEEYYLVQRLARANTHRRQQFGQWRRHRLKLESTEMAFAQKMENQMKKPANTELLDVTQGSEKGTFSLPSTATRLDEYHVDISDTASVSSGSSFAISFTEDNEHGIDIPPLHEGLCTGKDFECPYCHILCSKSVSKSKAWERHVLRDLRPYVCTYEDCTEADQQYDNIKDWINHENSMHRETKRHMYDTFEQPSDAQNLRQAPRESLTRKHPISLCPDDTWREECPICLKEDPNFSHIAFHLQKIAAFALPSSEEPDEDSTLGDQDSKAANIDIKSSMSSLGTFEMLDEHDLHEEDTHDHWKNWKTKTARDIAPTVTASNPKGVQFLEHILQQENESTEKGLDMNTWVSGLETGSSLLYQGKHNDDRPVPVIRQLCIFQDVSFYAQIEPLTPNYEAHPRPAQCSIGFWVPPNIRTGYTRGTDMLLRWSGGTMTRVKSNDPVSRSLNQVHSAATVFSQNPDTPHLLVVPFDAQKTHAYQNPGGWKPLTFHHIQKANARRTYYSAVSTTGDHQYIGAPGSQHWMPQLLPSIYNYQMSKPRLNAGLIGSIPLLVALAAFSAPPAALSEVLTNCVRPNAWRPHQYHYPTGHLSERGMAVTIFFDPANPQGSNPAILDKLQDGGFGPFYN